MAKTIIDEKLKLSIIIDGNPAQQELFKLEKATRQLNQQNVELRKEKQLLEKQGKKDTERYKAVTASLKENTAAVTANKAKMAELTKEIGIMGMTMGQLQSRAALLKNTLRNLVPGSEDYKRYNEELSAIGDRMSELKGGSDEAESSIGSLADGFNRYAALGASIIAVFTGVVVSIQKVLDWNAQLSDAQANVMKTTGMTKGEVDKLTHSFGLLQTRTARIDLLGIAEVGGRLGIAKDEIGDFVKVMDKASVALGDSFEGGPDVVADKLGKIKGLYDELKDTSVEVAFNSVGSAINDLGADGTATEQNLAAFATRVGTLPGALKPSISQALGLGAAFEESGLQAELAGNNYGKVISIAARDFPKFAKIMGESEEKVKQMLNTDPTEFFLQFASSLKGLDATDLASVLDYLKLNDNEVKMVLGAASENVDLFREKIDLANDSLNEGTSLTKEFDIKNNNLAATLEKLKKTVIGAFSSETIVNWLAESVEWLAKFLNATQDTEGSAQKWRNTIVFVAKALAVVTAAIVTNVAWQKLVVMWTTRNTQANLLYTLGLKARAFTEGAGIVVTQLYAAVTMLLTGNIKGATQALRIMAATMRTTPWGLVFSLIAAVTTAYLLFSESTEKAAKVQKVLSDVHLEATKSISKEKVELDLLTKIAKDETIQKEKRLKAIEKLNEIIPDYIGTLTLENIKMMEGTDILKKYTEEIYANARAKAAQGKFEELAKQELEIQNKSAKDYKEEDSGFGRMMAKITGQGSHNTTFDDSKIKNQKDVENYLLKFYGDYLEKRKDPNTGVTLVNSEKWEWLLDRYMKLTHMDDKQRDLDDVKAQMEALESDVVKATVKDLDKKEEDPTRKINIPTDEKKKKEKKYDDSYLREEEKYNDDLLKIRKKSEQDQLELMQEGFEKEMAQEKLNHKYKIAELQNEKVTEAQLKKMDKDIDAAEKANDAPKIKALQNIKKMMLEKNAELNQQILLENGLHLKRISTLEEKALKELTAKEKEEYELRKTQRETIFNNEYAALGVNEKAKARLKKIFDEETLKEDEKFLNTQIEKLKKIISGGVIPGFDFSLLTDEQKEKIKADIAVLENAISKLQEAKKGKKNNPSKELDLGLGSDNADILGFTQDQWDSFLKNIQNGTIGIQTMQMAVGAVQNMWGQLDSFIATSEATQLKTYEKNSESKKRRLKQQLDNGMINQVQYKKGIEKVDDDLDKKKADVEYKQAKRQRIMALANIAMSTSQAIMSIWAQVPKFDFGATAGILTGIVAATGALQAATVLATPLPAKGYEDGLYPDYVNVVREQDGKKYRPKNAGKLKSGLVTKNSLMVAEGNKPEMVIDNKAWRKIPPEVKDSLIRSLQGVKGFENGYYKDNVLYTGTSKPEPTPTAPAPDNQLLLLMYEMIRENTEVMREIKDSGLMAIVSSRDMKSMKELQEGLKKIKENRDKAKI